MRHVYTKVMSPFDPPPLLHLIFSQLNESRHPKEQVALCDGQGAREPQVTTAGTDSDVEVASGDDPFLGRDIPDAEVAAAQFEGSLGRFARREQELLEAAQLARWCGCRFREPDVQLCYLGTIDLTRVSHRHGDCCDGFPEVRATTRDDIACGGTRGWGAIHEYVAVFKNGVC